MEERIKAILRTKVFWFLGCCLLLTGCADHVVVPPYVVKDVRQQEIIEYLERFDIQVLRVGEHRTIVIEDREFVPPYTHRLNNRDRRILTAIADYIRMDHKITVTLAVYPQDMRRAKRIAWFLWSLNIDARLMETKQQQTDVVDVECPRVEIQYKVIREEVMV